MTHPQVDKDQVKVKIKIESAIINGNVHILVNGRLSDYMTAHVGKFIPVTDAEVFYIKKTVKNFEGGIVVKRKIIFINVEKIEMIEYL